MAVFLKDNLSIPHRFEKYYQFGSTFIPGSYERVNLKDNSTMNKT